MNIPDSVQRVINSAAMLGEMIEVNIHDAPTRTAEEAATACNCDVGQIVKSLIFRGEKSNKPYLLLVSGRNRVDETGMIAKLGEKLRRPDGKDVRAITGFAIGGIPPFGHLEKLETIIDHDLLAYDLVWAAAGTSSAVFPIAPGRLAQMTNARALMIATGTTSSA